ncbi:hypothetical protein [Sphingobium sp. B2]|uniref:hypothetical protein n=1 Tax=Sphingobium sp. B2 TaxID=2583228 RepID=UPI0011A21E18|nr:hypothetical protein [Sphingobium sp. B2]
MIGFLLALVAASPPACQPLAGADALAQQTKARWIMLGESHHGTVEQPQAAIDVMCAFMKAHRSITIGIEHSTIEQPLIDAYLKSDGGFVAQTTLFQGTNWDPRYQDGKGSQAMLGLFDWLRRNVQAGRIRNVVAFSGSSVNGDASVNIDADSNRQMAENLRAAQAANGGVVIALTGAVHAQKIEYTDTKRPFAPAAMLLPRDGTISILIEGEGGTTFNCEDQGCHIYPVAARPHVARALTMKPAEPGFDGVLELGKPETASNPANSN